MTTQTPTFVILSDRNESKFLSALGVVLDPLPRDSNTLDFEAVATEELFNARREYAMNGFVRIQDYIRASREIDRLIYEHRQRGVK
jgi:hypothetical protein